MLTRYKRSLDISLQYWQIDGSTGLRRIDAVSQAQEYLYLHGGLLWIMQYSQKQELRVYLTAPQKTTDRQCDERNVTMLKRQYETLNCC